MYTNTTLKQRSTNIQNIKIFVGTMECGENDFNDCKSAIKQQIGVDICHFVVSNLPEPEAHERLFNAWEQVKSEYDLFLKVDADTILSHNLVAYEFAKLFIDNENLTGVQAWLHDYMTDSKIYGLSCMHNTVTLSKSKNPLYPDRVDEKHKEVLRGDELPDTLNPAGLHCQNPSDIQSFHYGVHRALKNQTNVLSKVRIAWEKYGDRKRALALIGQRYAVKFVNNLKFNYNDIEFKIAFKEVIETYDNLLRIL